MDRSVRKKIDYLLAVEIETDQSINSGRVAIESVEVCCLKWYTYVAGLESGIPHNERQ